MPPVPVRIDQAGVDPKAKAAIEKSLKGREQAPQTSEQTGSFVDWQAVRDNLGQPFIADKAPPLRKLREIRRDPMVAFGLHFRQTPLVRVQWHMDARDKNGPNAQVAGFMDSAWRQIHARYVMQHTQDQEFGFAAIVKRFQMANPGGTYYDALEEDQEKATKPVWDEGSVLPIIWKPFVGLPPERVAPNFTPDGEFDGINYETITVDQAGRGTGKKAKPKKTDDKFRDIDVYHALWATHDKDSVHGCSPAGEPVLTTEGYVDIDKLNPDVHRLASFSQGRIRRGGEGNGAKGFSFEIDSRPYQGVLYTILANGGQEGRNFTRVTPNHKLTVRWSRAAEDKWAVYLMKKKHSWRLGITRLHRDRGHACSGLGNRLHTENADCGWLIGIFDSKREAMFSEKQWSHDYGIPEWTFKVASSSNENTFSQDDLDELWGITDSYSGASKLLSDSDLLEEYPLYIRNNGQAGRKKQHGWSVNWTCHAVNLMPGLMLLPVDSGQGQTVQWSEFDIEQSQISEDVYSLEVLPHHHYISNGIVTQNSIYGYPLIAHSFRFWWSYWFLWANLDRAFERSAVPPMIAYHPEGNYTDDDGLERPFWEIALEAAERLRSNAIAAIPSTMATAGLEDKGTSQREWAFEFLEAPTQNFTAINEHLAYLDVMKLRSVMVPEMAFIEGDGGSSSRNVATQMGEIFNGSQENKWEEIADHINRFIIPQLLAVNFPEFVNNGGSCRIVGHGFAKEDTEFLKQIIQLVGQGDPLSLGVDIREALGRIGAPLLTPVELQKQQAELAAAAQAGAPPPVAPAPGQVGVIANPNLGGTNGGSVPEPNAPGSSATGFADSPWVYVNPRPIIELSEHDDFLAGLPPTAHYKDKTMRALSVQMRKLWLGALREIYPDFSRYIIKQNLKLALDDEDIVDIALADPDRERKKAERLAKKLVNGWSISNAKITQLAARSKQIADKMIKRAAKLRNNNVDHEKLAESYENYLERNIGRLIKSTTETTKDNIRTLLVNDIMEGKGVQEIGRNIQDHFAEFPDWRADRIARSETRDAFNYGTLIAAKDSGLKYARAKDAQSGPTDKECEERDGKLYTITEALNVSYSKTHANDTLEWEPVARANFSVENVAELPPKAPEGSQAWFDASTETAYVPFVLSDDETHEFLGAVVDTF